MEVMLMRHGRTAANMERRYCGATDEPLCPEGVALVRLSGADGSTTQVYVSPLLRAMETARIKFPNAVLVTVHDLMEMNFGVFEGRTADEMVHDPDYVKWLESNCTQCCPGGEQMDDFADRVCAAFDRIVRESIGHGDAQLVVVAHGGTLMAILSRYGHPGRSYYEWYVDNCCGYRARLDETTWTKKPVLTDCSLFEKLP
jgi:alpha-ribazole phosphatase